MTENPALLSYAGRPVERVRAGRDHYVALALQIIQAWHQAAAPTLAEFAVASFNVWSDLCREPLLWLGKADPATALRNHLMDPRRPNAEGVHGSLV